MKYLPIENITYKTRLKEEEVLKRLADSIEPEKIRFGLFDSSATKPYEGQIDGASFRIKRIIRYRNSFLPRISGTIVKDFDGTTINVKMKLHPLVMVFICFWCGSVGLAGITIMAISLRNASYEPASLIPFGMFIFAYGLTMGCFKYESNKSKSDLQTILEADIPAA